MPEIVDEKDIPDLYRLARKIIDERAKTERRGVSIDGTGYRAELLSGDTEGDSSGDSSGNSAYVFRLTTIGKNRREKSNILKLPSREFSQEDLDYEVSLVERVQGHTQIMQLVDIIEDGYPLYRDYGKNTFTVSSKKPQDMFEAYEQYSQILSAVIHIHKKRIVHRDIKTDNICLENKAAYIIDFDNAITEKDLRYEKKMIISPGYSDPWSPNHKSLDTFSLGALLYYIIAGYAPYDKELERIDEPHDDYTKLAETRPPVQPKNMEDCTYALITRMMQKSYHNRPKLVEALAFTYACSAREAAKSKLWKQVEQKKRLYYQFRETLQNPKPTDNIVKEAESTYTKKNKLKSIFFSNFIPRP